MSGLVATFSPRGVPGLELGGARFFHTEWPENGILHAPFGRPFEGILKQQLATSDNPTGESPDNQLASVFFRWVFPAAGLDVYGEYGREDHNQDIRDFWQEPDHDAGIVLGLEKAWRQRNGVITVARGEVLNTRRSPLAQGRPQAPWYIHSPQAQGHTENGQLLGAIGAYGGGAAVFAVDRYSADGRWTVEWNRFLRGELVNVDGLPQANGADVLHALGIERSQNIGRNSLILATRAVLDLNRDFGRDKFNLNLSASYRMTF